MKRLFTFCLATLFASSLLAIPAMPVWRSVRQTDGTTLRLKLVGDEHFHYAVTDDGIPVVSHDGNYYYAHISGGHLVASDVLAHARDHRKLHEERIAASLYEVEALDAETHRQATQRVGTRAGVVAGKKKGLVILVQFSNKQFTDPTNVLTLGSGEKDVKTLYSDMLNKDGYTDSKSGAIGSVHNYFHDQSNGLFDLSFDVVGPVTLDHPYSYYGAPSGNEADSNAPQMVIDACNAVKGQVNFADYDWDNDGEVEQVYIVYAGEGQATGGDENTIWPHQYALQYSVDGVLALGSVRINKYACSNEIIRANVNGRSRIYYMGIGTICHEFSHCLGLPDLYDTSYGSFMGTGRYDLMCSGSYNGGPKSMENLLDGSGIGTVPAGYTSYERAFMGWLKPTDLSSASVDVKGLKGLAEGGGAYLLRNPSNGDEYYLFENRTQQRWDSHLPGYGLLALHVDYDKTSWESNTVNTSAYQQHPRLTILPADGFLTTDTQLTDPFPIDGNNELTGSASSPLSFYSGFNVPSQSGLTGISRASDGSISFAFTPLTATSGIAGHTIDDESPQTVYSLSGIRLGEKRQSGQGIVIMKGKTVKKVIIK